MNHGSLLKRLLVALCFIAGAGSMSQTFAGTVTVSASYPSGVGQAEEGGAVAQLIDTTASTKSVSESVSTTVSDTVATENQTQAVQAGATATSVGLTYSKNMKVYKIPVSYTFSNKWKVGLTVPYIEKKLKGRYGGTTLSDKGVGDIALSLENTWQGESLRVTSTVYLKFPTGNNKAFKNGQERLALGTGSYDWTWAESVVAKTRSFENMRWLGGFNFRFNGQANYSETADLGSGSGVYTFKDKKGNSLALYAGAVWLTPYKKFALYGTVSASQNFRSHEEYSATGKPSVSHDLQDSITTADVTPGLRYQFSPKSAARLGASIPVYTKFDKDVVDPKPRGVTLDFGVDYVF